MGGDGDTVTVGPAIPEPEPDTLADAGVEDVEIIGDPENGSHEAHPEISREELIAQVRARLSDAPSEQARDEILVEMLVEVYVSQQDIVRLLGQIYGAAANPKGILKMLLGRKKGGGDDG